MRMIQALVGGIQLTARQLLEVLPDVPQATLYRHLNKLTEAKLLEVVEQRQIRGTIEKVYALPEQNVNITQDDLVNASKDDHMRYFSSFVMNLLGDFGRYLQQENVDLLADGVGYRQAPLYLSDEEFTDFIDRLKVVMLEATSKKPAPGRRRRTFTTIVIPEPAHPLQEK